MRHVLSALLLLLLLSVQQASGRAVLQPENGTGESYATHYWSEGASVQDDTGVNWPLGYDLVSDVCDGPNLYAYVQQNPWTKFDPDGLFWAFAVDAAFAAWDAGQYFSGNISHAEYNQRMAITLASVALNAATGGGFTGGGLFAQAGGRAALKAAVSPAGRAAMSGLIQTASHIEDFAKAGTALNSLRNRSEGSSSSDTGVNSSESSGSAANEQQPKVEAKFHGTLEASASKRQGGTNVLRDQATDEVVRSGRTNDLVRREGEHARDPLLKDYRFEPVHRTNVYDVQRGLEKLLHDLYKPRMNKIRPVSPANPKIKTYEEAADKFLGK